MVEDIKDSHPLNYNAFYSWLLEEFYIETPTTISEWRQSKVHMIIEK